MVQPVHDVVGLGSAIVDIIARCDDGFIEAQGLTKGTMRLIDAEEATRLYAEMGPAIEVSGGTVPNSCVGVASFGGKAGFMGKTAKDPFGEIFAHDLRAAGVTFNTPPTQGSAPTARCLILVTPDGERTMNTFLGAAAELSSNELDPALIGDASHLYLEGYSFDGPQAKAAFYEAATIAREAGTIVSLTLSDPFCVERHREAFLDFIRGSVDLLFANQSEVLSLYQTDDLTAACARLRTDCALAAVTCSEKGSVIVTPGDLIEIPAEPVARVLDTTGAGDLYAAGFLFGRARGLDLRVCGRLASIAAAEVISHIGPRPETSLAALARAQGLI
ncbi:MULTISPECIES: adenosine kinase [Rhodomicrobium]|uniref:adenosine kinase n=1 Tax=Rhodomicrobium TaxID=1068 RepID=UPI000B4B38A9|nr:MULTISPECIES: adenosine kinase [Rhodomicrobium]